MKERFAIFISWFLVLSCHGNKKDHLSDDRMRQVVMEQGNRISLAAQKALGGQLKAALAEGGVQHAVQFCHLAAYPILDTLSTDLAVTVKRTSLKLRNPKNQPGGKEKQVLKNYTQLQSDGEVLKPMVEMLDKDQMLYAKPILLDNPLCLNCHGQVGTQITEENYGFIKNLYSQDEAINFEMGDFRGIWSITFDKEDLLTFLQKSQ